MGQETARRAHRAGQGYKHADGPRGPDLRPPWRWAQRAPSGPSRVPVVQVELQGSCDESFHRYMSAGLTPCLRDLDLVLKAGEAEKGLSSVEAHVLITGAGGAVVCTCPEPLLRAEGQSLAALPGAPVPTV